MDDALHSKIAYAIGMNLLMNVVGRIDPTNSDFLCDCIDLYNELVISNSPKQSFAMVSDLKILPEYGLVEVKEAFDFVRRNM